MKRLLAPVLIWAVLALEPAAALAAAGEPPATGAASLVLMDGDSGRVLHAVDPHRPRLIASVTKLMTALVALESGRQLDETVVIRPEWTGIEGSSLYLRAGERVTLETLLYGMLLQSGNDAATAVAGFCGGTVEDFVAAMNRQAARLGMVDSHFANPSGLNEEGHCASAYDLALLARACLDNETLATMVATRSVTLEERTFTNHNKLLWRYEGCVGLKTGYTERAGRTLVSAARREGMTLICVTLNDPGDWADHAALLDYGFSAYRREQVARAGERAGALPVEGSLVPTCPVVYGADGAVALSAGERLARRLVWEEEVPRAPLRRGERLGEAVYSLDGREVLRVPLVAGQDVPCDAPEAGGLWARLRTALTGGA